MVQVKICGIKTPEMLQVAVESGARFIGFVFYPPSPRAITPDTAKELALMLPTGVRAVGLFVDPTDEFLLDVTGHVPLDMLQLHGHETPERVAEIKDKFSLPIIKAFPVSGANDLKAAEDYTAADWFLFDAKPQQKDVYGGMGQSFDWTLLRKKTFSKPWMLSGGLTPENVGEALSILSPTAVDVSSGVESSRGVKDESKIRYFLQAAY